jgi:hypothetical protein
LFDFIRGTRFKQRENLCHRLLTEVFHVYTRLNFTKSEFLELKSYGNTHTTELLARN